MMKKFWIAVVGAVLALGPALLAQDVVTGVKDLAKDVDKRARQEDCQGYGKRLRTRPPMPPRMPPMTQARAPRRLPKERPKAPRRLRTRLPTLRKTLPKRLLTL